MLLNRKLSEKKQWLICNVLNGFYMQLVAVEDFTRNVISGIFMIPFEIFKNRFLSV